MYPLFWDGITPPNNENAIGSRRPSQKKKKKITLLGGSITITLLGESMNTTVLIGSSTIMLLHGIIHITLLCANTKFL